jgi:hypothetical protein
MSEPMIVSDPKVMMGKAAVAGTRITVDLILARVRKQLWDLLPSGDRLAGRAKQVASALVMVAIGAFGSPATSAVSSVADAVGISAKRDQEPESRLILQQPAAPMQMQAGHWSHSSHSSHWSHSSHSSHHSHYSSRY